MINGSYEETDRVKEREQTFETIRDVQIQTGLQRKTLKVAGEIFKNFIDGESLTVTT